MDQEANKIEVLIIGAGPAGLATSACLNRLGIPNVVLEREDCSASLWRRRSYDRLKLHLAKQFCELPHMAFPRHAPTFVPKQGFTAYLDEYVTRFGINPRYNRRVTSASHEGGWGVEADDVATGGKEVYVAEFLVVATGENGEGVIPAIEGLKESFGGEYMHSSDYKNGHRFAGKNVLVVGCGNSGMEIAYDLSKSNANVSLVVRSPVHVLTKCIVQMAMTIMKLKIFPVKLVDTLCLFLAKMSMGDTSRYGLQRPKLGPFLLKMKTGRSPTIDVGCLNLIKSGNIRVVQSIKSIEGNRVKFVNGENKNIDAIIFATGYKSNVARWLQVNITMFPLSFSKRQFPDHWKGQNGLYCAGFARQGLVGISRDAQSIARDIDMLIQRRSIL
ncbi:PREDICTED: probable indole-3-pyruvate monooxygenase YUCCA11 [Tarenaya hassleriana]|uniref:probable indole-3-pyruvate monooxygenase YUCCA11 n=1 Tax=Tarenaya hassleriana TaxID=28532 RepID=UPI00053C2C02|nr:PREDICTED: probable indole-3-pyruvate monooxygenase YUCCA11 [Tarenaya hassleriana]